MKKLTLLFAILTITTIEAQCIRTAPFANGPFGDYAINGVATLSFLTDGTKTLAFDSAFGTSSGPDLHVYLSQASTVSTPGGVLQTPNTIDLGLLKSASGSQSYDLSAISPVVNLDSYDYVIIHCKEFDHYWGTGTFGVTSGPDCASLSVFEAVENTIEVYPTLVRGDGFQIIIPNGKHAKAQLFSVTGKSVGQLHNLIDEINFVQTSFLPRGIYILQVEIDTKRQAQKIIID